MGLILSKSGSMMSAAEKTGFISKNPPCLQLFLCCQSAFIITQDAGNCKGFPEKEKTAPHLPGQTEAGSPKTTGFCFI
jgi:hypothetical protein